MNELLLNILFFLGGFALLTGGAEFLVRGASRLAIRLSISPVVVGLTVVAFGTSLPELLVSLFANLRETVDAGIAIGNVVGSNIANLALILGVVSVIAPVSVERDLLRREYPLMLVVSVIFTGMAWWDGSINRIEGIILVLGLIGFTVWSYTVSRSVPIAEQEEVAEYVGEVLGGESETSLSDVLGDLSLVAVGIVGLVIGANWLVNSATFLALVMGVSELVIGLSLVALGTSLPELATSVIAMVRSEGDIAVGNLVGSNLFNMLAIIGITATVKPLQARTGALDFPVMLLVAVLPLLLVAPRPHVMSRWNGAIMLSIYVGYMIWLFSSGNLPTAV